MNQWVNDENKQTNIKNKNLLLPRQKKCLQINPTNYSRNDVYWHSTKRWLTKWIFCLYLHVSTAEMSKLKIQFTYKYVHIMLLYN